MFCPNCGNEIDNDSKFCCFCGNKIEIVEELNNEPENTDSESGIQKKDNSFLYKSGLIILIVILSIFCTVIFYNTNGNSFIQNKNARLNSIVVNELDNKQLESDNSSAEQYISSSTIYNNKLRPLFTNLSANLKSGDFSNNDITFYNFQKEFSKIIDGMNETNVDNIYGESVLGSKIIDGNKNLYNQMNVSVLTNEGTYYFNENWGQLQSDYGKYLSPTYNDWLAYLDRNKKIFEDAGLVIEVDELRNNITCLENILKNNNFVATNDVKEMLNNMVDVYLTGIDNTPAFSYDDGTLQPDFKSSYEKFISENQQSNYYPIVKQYYDMLKNNNYKKSDKISSWVRSQIQ